VRWTLLAAALWILLWIVDGWRRRWDRGVRTPEEWREERAARERAERQDQDRAGR
jgi:hypothetical protein